MIAGMCYGQSIDTIDYSYLSFDALNDFYNSKGVNVVSADNPDLYFEIFDWLNTPYQWAGRSKAGVDCSDLVSLIYNKLYQMNLGGSAGDIFKKCEEVLPSELQEGDLLFFNINGHYLYHVGIYLQNGMFAHAAVHGGVIVSNMDEVYYKTWFYKAGRVKQTDDATPTPKFVPSPPPASVAHHNPIRRKKTKKAA